MPAFKPKCSKLLQVCSKSSTTLDNKHKSILNEIDIEEKKIPELKKRRKNLKNLLEKTNQIENQLEINDKITEINKEIKEIKCKRKNYYLTNSKFIFDYYENKIQASEGNNKTTILNSFFNIGNNELHNKEEITGIQQYLSNIDDSFININNFVISTDICKKCGEGELIPIDHEGMIVCNNCSNQVCNFIDCEKPSYKEPPKEVCFYAYKRINHFREILAQFQAKETTQIPDIVLSNIKSQIKKERINPTQLTNKRAKEILKKLGYNKYYEHIPFIKDKLGIKPPVMSPQLEERLCSLFMDIQAPYAKYCPEDRVNFLNYYYTVYKLCELLDKKQFLPFFPMLKDREKRIEQDEIWKKICYELNWEFIPTI